MKLFNSKTKSSKSTIRNLLNDFKLCSGGKSEVNYESISYKSMSEPIQIPATIETPLPQHLPQLYGGGKPLKSCLKKQPARSNLHTHFAQVSSWCENVETPSASLTATPEKARSENILGRMLSSTTLDSPVVAFSNATYAGSPVQYSKHLSPCSIDDSSERTYVIRRDDTCPDHSSSSSSSASTTIEDLHACDVYAVCCVPYVARSEKELTIEFADRLRVVQASPDWCLVQDAHTSHYGYVPSASLVSVEQFLNDLAYLTRRQYQATEFFGYI